MLTCMCRNLAKVNVWVEVPQNSRLCYLLTGITSPVVVAMRIYYAFIVNDLASFLNLVFCYN